MIKKSELKPKSVTANTDSIIDTDALLKNKGTVGDVTNQPLNPRVDQLTKVGPPLTDPTTLIVR
ncbi:MAG: hypothetical protein WAV41_01010 [Microgenomates group bacterium]